MSFSELLKKAYAEAKEISDIQKSHRIDSKKLSDETNMNNQRETESKTETISDRSNDITIGQAIMIIANNGLKNTRKLKSTGKCKRLAKNFISGQCTPQHLVKAKNHIQKLRSPKHGDFQLCGGWATIEFFEQIEKGLTAKEAMDIIYKGPANEKENR